MASGQGLYSILSLTSLLRWTDLLSPDQQLASCVVHSIFGHIFLFVSLIWVLVLLRHNFSAALSMDIRLSVSASAKMYRVLRIVSFFIVVAYCFGEIVYPEIDCSRNNREASARSVQYAATGSTFAAFGFCMLFAGIHIYRTVKELDAIQLTKSGPLFDKLACMCFLFDCCSTDLIFLLIFPSQFSGGWRSCQR